MMTFRFYDLLTRAAEQNNQPPEHDESSPPLNTPTPLDQIRSQTWQTLVLSQKASEAQIGVTDDEVRTEVKQFFTGPGGVFDHVFYESWIENNFRGRPREYEEVIRKHIRARKFMAKQLEGVSEEERNSRWMSELISIMSEAKIEDYTIQGDS
jgi:hypothetical protein